MFFSLVVVRYPSRDVNLYRFSEQLRSRAKHKYHKLLCVYDWLPSWRRVSITCHHRQRPKMIFKMRFRYLHLQNLNECISDTQNTADQEGGRKRGSSDFLENVGGQHVLSERPSRRFFTSQKSKFASRLYSRGLRHLFGLGTTHIESNEFDKVTLMSW